MSESSGSGVPVVPDPAVPETPVEAADASDTGPAPPNALPVMEPPPRFRMRFSVLYTALALTGVGAIAGFVILTVRPGHTSDPPWSTWKPPSGTTAKMASAIAEHVSHEYKLNAKGSQLVAVVSGPPKVTSGTKDVKISAIALRKAPGSNSGIQVVPSNKTWTNQFCGLGNACSIASGQATALRGRLVRREALEVALYTFKFIPAIDSVVAFMPPPPGSTTTTLLYLQKSNLSEELSTPLKKTLTASRPPLPTQPDTSEAATIDRLTLPAVYSYTLTQLQDGSAALILDPVAT